MGTDMGIYCGADFMETQDIASAPYSLRFLLFRERLVCNNDSQYYQA